MPATTTQTVYIANFGHGNYLWPDCLARSTIAMFQDADLQQLWLDDDRAGYVAHCLAHKKTAAGTPRVSSVANRSERVNEG